MPGGVGGAHKKPAPEIDPVKLHESMAKYLFTSPAPSQFGPYNGLKRAQAAHGRGLLHCKLFLDQYLMVSPEARPASKQMTTCLWGLVRSGAMSRFPVGHACWQGLSQLEGPPLKLWVDRQVGKIVVVLYHLRRVAMNALKRAQACRTLDDGEKAELHGLIAKVLLRPTGSQAEGDNEDKEDDEDVGVAPTPTTMAMASGAKSMVVDGVASRPTTLAMASGANLMAVASPSSSYALASGSSSMAFASGSFLSCLAWGVPTNKK